MYTEHGHVIENTERGTIPPERYVNCGGTKLCPLCKAQEQSFLEREASANKVLGMPRTVGNEHHEPIAPMNEGVNYQVRARYTLIKYIDNDFLERGVPVPAYEVYIVWFCKILQNWKAILGTTMPDGKLYEMTYNGNEDVAYVDEYSKNRNTTMKVEFE